MKPAEARRLAEQHTMSELAAAAALLREERDAPFPIAGAEHGDKLTHVLLAMRIRERVDRGIPLIAAFREVMTGVRAVLMNR